MKNALYKFTCLLILILLLSVVTGGIAKEHVTQRSKPSSPVTMTISSKGAVASGSVVQLVVTLRCSVSASNVRVKIMPVAGAKQEGGIWSWSGHLEKNVPIEIPLIVRVPVKGGGVKAHAVVRLGEGPGASFGANASFMFAKKSSLDDTSPSVDPTHSIKTDALGRRIKEFKSK